MDLELSNFVRDFLDLVTNYGKSRIEKKKRKEKKRKERKKEKKRKTSWICHQIHVFFLFCFVVYFVLFCRGVGYVSIMVSFVIMIRNSLIQMQVINSLYIFVHPHLPVKYHCTYTWVDISSLKTKDRGTGSQKHTGLCSSGVLILLRDRQVRRYCDGRLENCIEKFMSGLNF